MCEVVLFFIITVMSPIQTVDTAVVGIFLFVSSLTCSDEPDGGAKVHVWQAKNNFTLP